MRMLLFGLIAGIGSILFGPFDDGVNWEGKSNQLPVSWMCASTYSDCALVRSCNIYGTTLVACDSGTVDPETCEAAEYGYLVLLQCDQYYSDYVHACLLAQVDPGAQ